MCYKKLEDYANVGTLSAKEKQLFELLLAGKNNGEIADALHISTSTMEDRITDLYIKLDITGLKDKKKSSKRIFLMGKVIEWFKSKNEL